MRSLNFLSESTQETIRLGTRLADCLKKGDIVCLFGDLGSGKTTFTKGIARGLKINANKVNSPTFVLMNAYQGKHPLFHFDFYRLDKATEISAIGYEEFFYDNGITVIEWPQRLGRLLPKDYLHVKFTSKGEGKRSIHVSVRGKRSSEILARLLK